MREADRSLRSYLDSTSRALLSLGRDLSPEMPYSCTHDFVLDHGTFLQPAPLTDDELSVVFAAIDARGGRFPVKQCFWNSQSVVLADATGTLEYFEGFAQGGVLPVTHSWIVVNRKVVDLTWRLDTPQRGRRRLRDRAFGVFPSSRSYCGVPFSHADIAERMHKSETWGSIIDWWEANWPALHRPRRGPAPEPFSGLNPSEVTL